MKIFLNDNFQIESISDTLEDMIVKGSTDYDELIVYLPTETKESYTSIYPLYSVRRADNREIGPYATIQTADDSEDDYYGWKGNFNARDLAVEGALEITITFVINGTQKKNIGKVTTYVKDAVATDGDILIINEDSVESLLDSIESFLETLATKADLTNSNQTITAYDLEAYAATIQNLTTDTITHAGNEDYLTLTSSGSSNTVNFKIDPLTATIEVVNDTSSTTMLAVSFSALGIDIAIDNGTECSIQLLNDGIYVNDVKLANQEELCGIFELSSSSGTLDDDQIAELSKPTAIIHYNNRVYHKLAETSSVMTFVSYDMLYSNDTTFNFARYLIQITLSTYAYTTSYRTMTGYTTSQADDLLDEKVNYSDIKDSLTSTSTDTPLSAYQGKVLNEKILAILDGSSIDSFADTESALALKSNIADIVDDLTDTSTTKPLSANQGYVLKSLIDAINTLLESDDTTLDEIQEIVDYVKDNRELIESITDAKVSVTDIIDNLTSAISDQPLSANQGYVLKGLIDDIVDGTTTVTNATNATYATNDANGNDIVDTYLNHEDAFASGMIAVGDYDEDNGTITLTYESDVVSVDYDEDTGIVTFTY